MEFNEYFAQIWNEARLPIGTSVGMIHLLLDGKLGPLTDKQIEFLETIERNTYRTDECLSHLADCRRISQDDNRWDLQPVFLPDVVEQAQKIVERYCKSISVEILIPSDFHLVLAHPYWLEKAITYVFDPYPSSDENKFTVEVEVTENDKVKIRICAQQDYNPGTRLVLAAKIIENHDSKLKTEYREKETLFEFVLDLCKAR